MELDNDILYFGTNIMQTLLGIAKEDDETLMVGAILR